MHLVERLRSKVDGDTVLERRVLPDGTEVFLCSRRRGLAPEPTYVVRVRAKGQGPAVVSRFASTRPEGQEAFDATSRRYARGVA